MGFLSAMIALGVLLLTISLSGVLLLAQPPPGAPAAAISQPTPEPTPVVPTATPFPPAGGSFGYGIQVHAYGRSDIADILAHVQDLRFGWVKQQLQWRDVETNAKGQYNWDALDVLVRSANTAGLNLLLSVVKAPRWARPATILCCEGPPVNPQDYGDFMRALAARYNGKPGSLGKVAAYEIWNEQNIRGEWGGEPYDAARYIELLKAGYTAVKSVDSDAVVVNGALTPAGTVVIGGIAYAAEDIGFLDQMYKLGLKNYADVIGVHGATGSNLPPDADCYHLLPPTTEVFLGPCGGKRLWVTEFGWAVDPNPPPDRLYAKDNNLDKQARWTVQAYQLGRTSGWVGAMFLWNLNFKFSDPTGETAMWGIVQPPNWTPLPVYEALKNMPKDIR
ncbi:MAG: hypothetical protein HY259_05025 [Chloroflexi bacterium]|nr:hypothetical protein [Chloroflexota bacterium]